MTGPARGTGRRSHGRMRASSASLLRRGLAAVLCATSVGACGASATARHTATTTASTNQQPVSVATFSCRQWLAAPAWLRTEVLRELHGFYGGPVSGGHSSQGHGTVLTDTRATRLFDSYCHQPFARNFTLYRLYARAAAFTGTAP